MALYAFDGTWNKDKPGTERDTNVLWFCSAYTEDTFYQKGVGTRVGKLGKIIGGISGAGGRSRVRKARKKLVANFNRGDTTIDIVGFSRGAALALHLANKIDAKGVETKAGRVFPKVRFLGLWDTVAAFLLPDVPANIGWDLDLPDCVEHCFHALALDEMRHAFKPERLEERLADTSDEGVLHECWFRGVHSDIGGGNKNSGLSSITLDWMFGNARRCGLKLDQAVIKKNRARIKPKAPISKHKESVGREKLRVVRATDPVHESVRFRPDTRARRHNNPPVGAAVVSNTGRRVRSFRRA
ncbi:MAG: phospholipase effector Tle1 domain-containing protein [Thermoanaerobaculia bacterium]